MSVQTLHHLTQAIPGFVIIFLLLVLFVMILMDRAVTISTKLFTSFVYLVLGVFSYLYFVYVLHI